MSRFLVLRFEVTDSSLDDQALEDLAETLGAAGVVPDDVVVYRYAEIETYN